MQQQLLEHIYLNYQPDHYFKTYLHTHKTRPDNRIPTQHRPLRLSITPTTIISTPTSTSTSTKLTITKSATTITVSLTTNLQQVVYSPVTKSYGKRLLDLNVNVGSMALGGSRIAKFQRNWAKFLQESVIQFVDWGLIEEQIVGNAGDKGLMGFVGNIQARVVGNDGGVEEALLIAIQTLLWTVQFPSIQDILQKKGSYKLYNLSLSSFYFPTKYVEIQNVLLLDPTLKQQENSNYELTLISNIKQQKNGPKNIARILKVHKNQSLPQQVIEAIEKLYIVGLEKLGFDIENIKAKCSKKEGEAKETVVVVISEM